MKLIYRKAQGSAFTLVCLFSGLAASQNIISSVPIPTASAGQVAVNPALNVVYASGGPKADGSLTVINGVTFNVTTTITPAAGGSVDMKSDNLWTGDFTSGDVVVYSGVNNVEISSANVGSCPAAVSFDCRGRMWVASQCGSGNDPLWVFEAKTLKLIDGPIPSGGTITQPPMANPDGEKLYVTSGGISKEIDPTTFAVSNTKFGTVLAIDSVNGKLFATSGDNLQIISGYTDAVTKTVTLTYTPAAIGVNNALGHVYVVNRPGNSIDVYNEAGKKLTSFLLGADSQPSNLAVDSIRGRLYVDVLNTATSSWFLDVIEDLSSARTCSFPGSCDY
jgi:DNA-binding beta-propeller fold protein YncE